MSKENNNSFDSMGLKPELQNALSDLKFTEATPIQSQAIPVILKSKNDLLGFAQTGTGKTAAFSLPILQQIDPSSRHVQALILCPTRELCMQITKDIKGFAKYLPAVKAVAIYGGSSIYEQMKELGAGAQIAVGTPGRIKDLKNRGKLNLNSIQWLVLDEADDMLDKGFKEDLDDILDETPEDKQILLFSATMSPWIQKVAAKRMHDPVEIRVGAHNQGADMVEHKYVTVHARDRYAALRRLLDVNPDVYGIVFCRTKLDTKEVAAKLMADNYSAQPIHGDISQDERSDAMARFRQKEIQILVATDVAARGIDVNDLTHVINYELPDSPEIYVHRSGRTGRAGKTGISLTIINMKERGKLRRIESIMRTHFTAIEVPTGREICEAQLMSLVHRVKTTEIDHANLGPYLAVIYEELKGLSYDELIQHFVSVEFNRFLQHYSNTIDISTQRSFDNERSGQGYQGRQHERGRGERGERGERGGSRSERPRNERSGKDIEFANYRVNFGKNDGFNPKTLFGLINKNKCLKGIEIGNIRMQADYTEFEADASFHEKTLSFLGRETYRNKKLKIVAV
ncbi:DEAD/DEAH box helicase [Candidatus Peregrinibacteria bacterium]|nr:DEAD/DEAH box helicase [Candidatus Peregrinibacteria bacterium]